MKEKLQMKAGKENKRNDDESNELIARFLKDALLYLENRINLVDNKASLFIAIQGGLFALVGWVTKEVFWTEYTSNINYASYIIIAIDFTIMIVTIILLVQTIRPSKLFFGLNVPTDEMIKQDYIMWFDNGFPHSGEQYNNRIDSLNFKKIRDNFEKAHYTTLQLVRRKYSYYRWATLSMKVMIVYSAIGLAILTCMRIF